MIETTCRNPSGRRASAVAICCLVLPISSWKSNCHAFPIRRVSVDVDGRRGPSIPRTLPYSQSPSARRIWQTDPSNAKLLMSPYATLRGSDGGISMSGGLDRRRSISAGGVWNARQLRQPNNPSARMGRIDDAFSTRLGAVAGSKNVRRGRPTMKPRESPKPDKRKDRKATGARWNRLEMLKHEVLTKEEEIDLGRKVVEARRLREAVGILLDERRLEMEMERAKIIANEKDKVDHDLEPFLTDTDEASGEMNDDFLANELDYQSLYGFRSSLSNTGQFGDDSLPAAVSEKSLDHSQHRLEHLSQMRESVTKTERDLSGYSSLVHLNLDQLTEEDIIGVLDIPGGKVELGRIFLDGSWARDTLMRRNIKLVVSIAKTWMQRHSPKTASEGVMISRMYEGGWDRPSLDEAVQDGVLGLARAVDKYDPERGFKFSTYATHWITSYVRVSFQTAATGCLHIPLQLHNVKASYQKLVKAYMESGEPMPAQESLAKQLGVSENRLVSAIRATEGVTSIDAPAFSSAGTFKGSSAGGDQATAKFLVSDTLHCMEPKAEDQIEISFLRQCLENAMATELTPFERDVLRLRLGLDSGETKTVREVSEICGGGVTIADVRETERRAFKKLRSPTSVHTHNLLAYFQSLIGV